MPSSISSLSSVSSGSGSGHSHYSPPGGSSSGSSSDSESIHRGFSPPSPVVQLPRRASSPPTNGHLLPPSPPSSPLNQQLPSIEPSSPQYAEDFTPLKLRRRKRKHEIPIAGPSRLPGTQTPGLGLETGPGPSGTGYVNADGDLYRGAVKDPYVPGFTQQVEEDAITLGGSSSTSTSSSWSWGSGLSIGRRATMAIKGVGEVLGVRRGSGSDTSSERAGTIPRRTLTRSKTRSRRLSATTVDSEDRPKRQQLPRRREFTLLLPPHITDPAAAVSHLPTPRDSLSSTSTPPTPVPNSERVITTPSLPIILERIRNLRLAAGILNNLTPPISPVIPTPIRGGSLPGKPRRPHIRQTASFIPPPVTRPTSQRAKSRLQTLREQSQHDIKRPKSVSDIIGMVSPASSTNLTDFKGSTPSSPVLDDEPRKGKGKQKGCWWLDVACPGWEDLRDLGELLGLHPLTLEDILQQDPREKLDTFDSLGYYFLVVRALDEGYFKYTPGSNTSLVGSGRIAEPELPDRTNKEIRVDAEELHKEAEAKQKEGRRRGWGMGRVTGRMAKQQGEKVEIVENNPGKEGLEGVGVGALNVYLVVFEDGIMSFHFEDISKHTKRVLNRVLSNASAREAPGSDWIAHGILDSIVDAFFPLIRYVDGEVDDIDTLTIDPNSETRSQRSPPTMAEPEPRSSETLHDDIEPEDKDAYEMKELKPSSRHGTTGTSKFKPRMSIFRSSKPSRRRTLMDFIDTLSAYIPNLYISLPRPFIYVKLFFLPVTSAVNRHKSHLGQPTFDRSTMLRKITDMRKLVTGLTRTLGAKHQVVGKLRKRAAESGGGVEAYIGDVEDHILLLQTSLYHYEYILSHCQPAYLSHLSVSSTWARGATDQAILALSTVTIGILPMQMVTGVFSKNVHIPGNNRDSSSSPYNYFAAIVVGIFLIACGVVTVVRYWRWQARVKQAKARNVELPSFKDGYWGWK